VLLLCYRYNVQDEIEICRIHSVLYYNEVTVMHYIYLSNLAVKQGCQLMRGWGPQFVDHMRSVIRARLQILSLASKIDRLKKSSGNKYALLVSKKFSKLRMGSLWPLASLHCGVLGFSNYAIPWNLAYIQDLACITPSCIHYPRHQLNLARQNPVSTVVKLCKIWA